MEEKLPKVCVIMSTYNGEKFVETQIKSILEQKDVEIDLHVFDDVSKDKTQEIVREYENKYSNVTLHVNEKNKNYTYNFIDGLFLFKNEEKYDYYAFSDQDDFWVNDKLSVAINKLKEIGDCSLYCSNLTIVDEGLNKVGRTYRALDFTFGKHEQLLRCLVMGCTSVFDKSFKNLATKYYPENLIYHDYWIGLIADYTKDAHFFWDKYPEHILYRQHGKNASGGEIKIGFSKIMSILFKGKRINFHILRLFLKYYEQDIDDETKDFINRFINYKKNKKFIKKHLECKNKKVWNILIQFGRLREKRIDEM